MIWEIGLRDIYRFEQDSGLNFLHILHLTGIARDFLIDNRPFKVHVEWEKGQRPPNVDISIICH